jgi:hypothetical protein
LLFDDRSASPILANYIYPNGEFLPRDGVQRGSLMVTDGDPYTVNYPSNGTLFVFVSNLAHILNSILIENILTF